MLTLILLSNILSIISIIVSIIISFFSWDIIIKTKSTNTIILSSIDSMTVVALPIQMTMLCSYWNSHYKHIWITLFQHQHLNHRHVRQYMDKDFHHYHLSVGVWSIGTINFLLMPWLKCLANQDNMSLHPYLITLVSCMLK